MVELKEYLFRGLDELPRETAGLANEPSLSPLADYVVDHLPQDLADIRAEDLDYATLALKHEAELTEALPAIEENQDLTTAQVTQLDLLFMFGAYIPNREDMYDTAPPASVVYNCTAAR